YDLTAQATDNFGGVSTSSVVHVKVAVPPTVSVTSPTNGASFIAPTNLTINVSAADIAGSVTQVLFFDGAFPLGTDTSSPLSMVWSNVPAGTYALQAVAINDSGLSATSSVVNITVTANLSPIADSYVKDGSSSNLNFGTSTVLETRTSSTNGGN